MMKEEIQNAALDNKPRTAQDFVVRTIAVDKVDAIKE